MDQKNMMISVLIPTRNRAKYLGQAIESVLAQDYPQIEIIVSDNASTDGTSELVDTYRGDGRLRYVRNERDIGLVANHRMAFELVRGEYFLILSDDDYLVDRGYLAKAAEIIRKRPELVMLYAQGYVLYEGTGHREELRLPFPDVVPGRTVFMSRGSVMPLDFTLCNVLFRTDIARTLDPFRNESNMSSDSELFLKMCLNGPVGVLKDFVSVYRVHPSNITSRILRDPKLLVHNLDFLVEPYRYAKDRGLLTQEDLRKWERQLLIPQLKMALLTALLHHKENADGIIASIRRKYSDLEIMRGLKLRIQFVAAQTSRALFYLVSKPYRKEVARERKK